MIGKIFLKKGKAQAVRRRHPWIFSGAIYRKQNCQPGGWVQVFDEFENLICQGHYHSGSIAVRVLSYSDEPIDQSFWDRRMIQALQLRKDLNLLRPDNNAYRLIHGEGDHLPGLIIDVYNDMAVIQSHTLAMAKSLQPISQALNNAFGNSLDTIYHKLPAHSDVGEGLEDEFILGKKKDAIVLENGHRFRVDVEGGQKTGFFLDQRENRQMLSHFSCDKEVLNLFSYTGGFSVYAGAGGAKKVTSVDVSASAIDGANQNMQMNELDTKHEGVVADVMKYLKDIQGYSQELMIVDPPAFAKSRKRSHNAVQAYKRLNAQAIRKMKPGSFIFTFSCSQVIGPKLFQDTITAAAIEVGREVQIIRHLSQGGDHPINIYHPEGKYLKGLLLRVKSEK